MQNMKPAIVIVAYNRDWTLRRILRSLQRAVYDPPTDLVISIDKSDNNDVVAIADGFQWDHGKKVVLAREERLGLKNHVLACGDLANDYGRIILLEDDLFVSPFFYRFAKEAASYYDNDPAIAGISLYSQRFNETATMGFRPFDDGSDVFFLQLASSWGQCWSSEQWSGFRTWYQDNPMEEEKTDDTLPPDVRVWPQTSWKRHFIRYMIARNKFFVYPRRSYTTNFHDPGTHHCEKITLLQVPLSLYEKPSLFKTMDQSPAVYDAYHEIFPDRLKRIAPHLEAYDLVVDLYGQKDPNAVKAGYLLTSKRSIKPLRRYGRELKPHELNVVYEIEGKDISLSRTSDCLEALDPPDDLNLSYYYNIPVPFLANPRQRALDEARYEAQYKQYKTLMEALEGKDEIIADLYQSASWKLTIPLRWLRARVLDLLRLPQMLADMRDPGFRLIRDSGLFDEVYYRKNYGDQVPPKMSPIRHFMEYGWKNGTNPNPLFHTSYYLEQEPGVAESGMNPLEHYINTGAARGINPNPLFDTLYYLEQNPDVVESGMNPLAHFIKQGAEEGRNPGPLFDSAYYVAQHQHVADSGMNPLVHYLQFYAQESEPTRYSPYLR
jgi:glycosyltransferase involved in cell wall biosynthesis